MYLYISLCDYICIFITFEELCSPTYYMHIQPPSRYHFYCHRLKFPFSTEQNCLGEFCQDIWGSSDSSSSRTMKPKEHQTINRLGSCPVSRLHTQYTDTTEGDTGFIFSREYHFSSLNPKRVSCYPI